MFGAHYGAAPLASSRAFSLDGLPPRGQLEIRGRNWTELLNARRDEWLHADRVGAIRMAVVMMESSIQSMVLFNDHREDETQFSDNELVDQLSVAMCAYLQVA